MAESMTDDQLENAVLVVEDNELEWGDDSISILGIPESVADITEKTAAIVLEREKKDPTELPFTNIKSVADITEATADLVIDKDRKEEIEVATAALFTNTKILESIICRVLDYHHPNKPIHFRKTVQQLRLVSKKFLQIVTQILRQKNQILFHLTLDKTNSLDNSPLVIEEFGKRLNNFVNWIYPDSSDSGSWYKEHRPLFGLKIMEDFFQEENHDSLLNCLLLCGEDLQMLEIFLPKNLFQCMFPPYQLPALETLIIHLGGPIVQTKFKYLLFNGNVLRVDEDNVFYFVNSLLTASSKLKRFGLENIKTKQYSGICNHARLKLDLPECIEKLEIDLKMATLELKTLLENPLPYLSSLRFALPEGDNFESDMSQLQIAGGILDCGLLKHTLKNLQIISNKELRPGRPSPFKFISIGFPQMEKLKSLEFIGSECQVYKNTDSMSVYLPVLERIHLAQRETQFRKWVDGSVYDGVHTVALELLSEQDGLGETLQISRESMQLLQSPFPNVTRLTLKMTDALKDGLQYLFREMTRLQFLKLCIVNTIAKNSDYWDALLIGITEQQLKYIREPDTIMPGTVLKTNNPGSVFMLNELLELHLAATHGCPDTSSLISDLAFVHAFLKMPKLRKLTLEGGFSASKRMCDKWKNQHRCSLFNGADKKTS